MARLPTQLTPSEIEIHQLEFSVALTTLAYERLIIINEDLERIWSRRNLGTFKDYTLKGDKYGIV